jgi:ABC-2 type transport system permease protein
MTAIFKREFKAYFQTPIGYIVLAAFYFFSGFFFMYYFANGVPKVEYVISSMLTVTVFIMPIITMRLMSDDKRQKVDQALLTAPVKLTSVVMGKFLAALAVFALGFVPTIIFEAIVMSYVKVNVLNFAYALIGILLLGGALISLGMFISTLTESSVVSAILTLVINILLLYISNFVEMISVSWIATVVEKLAIINKYTSFTENMIALPDIVYLLSATAIFIFLCVRALERRRWA